MATTPQMLSSTLVFLINGQGLLFIVLRVVKKLNINKCTGWKKFPYFKKLILILLLRPVSMIQRIPAGTLRFDKRTGSDKCTHCVEKSSIINKSLSVLIGITRLYEGPISDCHKEK